MKRDELTRLLKQRESETLEFKSEWYKIDDLDQKTRERQRGEMIKDILMLLNGNTISVGKEAHLIIGASDKPDTAGNRELFDTQPIDVDQARDIVNGYIEPRMESLRCETVKLPDPTDPANYKSIQVLSIGPSPNLHELTKEIRAKKRDYDERLVLIRHNGNVKVATMQERETLKKLKRVWFEDLKRVSPTWAGLIIATIIGGAIGYQPAQQNVSPLTRAVAAAIVSGLLGLGLGAVYSELWEFRRFLYRFSPKWRPLLVLLAVALSVVIGFLINQVYPFRTPVK